MTKMDEKWALVREMIGDNRLSIVLPVYNLASSFAKNFRETAELFARHHIRTELIPVDDGSQDASAKIIRDCVADWSREKKIAHADDVVMRPVFLAKNCGKGAALRAGFEASTGEFVMLLDGDLDIHPKQTPWFFDQMKLKAADIVVGSKRHHHSVVQYPWHRRLVSWVYFKLVKFAIGLPITDTQTGMKLFRRDILGAALARMLVKTFAFDLELLAIAHERGAKIAEAPVVIRFGQKFGCLRPRTVWAMVKDSLAVFYRLRLLHYYAKCEVPKPLATPPRVTVVIACPNDSWMLQQCLDALARQTYQNFDVLILPDREFSLAKNSNRENSARENFREKVRIIATGKLRPAEKRNFALRENCGDILAFIDDDAYPDDHWLEYAIRSFGDETIGALGGPAITPSDDPFFAKIGGRIYENILVSGNYRYRYKAGGVRREVDDFPSCNLFVRTKLFREMNGYRVDFWPGEDTLLCHDILAKNLRIVYDPWVIVAHHRREFLMPHLRQLGRYAFHRGFFAKRYPKNSRHLAYFIPSLFAIYCVTWPILAIVAHAAHARIFAIVALAYLAPLPFYFALVFATTFSRNPLVWLLSSAGVFATHLTYGVRFLGGLFAKKAPCEFIGKDHA